jgi:hypothetical protein
MSVPPAASKAGPVRVSRAVLPKPGPYEPTKVPRPRRDRFTAIEGQLAFDLDGELADVHDLFINPTECLEAAA